MQPKAQDTYFFGKEVAAMGRLALIADQIGDNTTAKEIRESMKKVLTPRLEGQCNDSLIYDSTWGGIVSTEGIKNSGNEFGQGWYNDHRKCHSNFDTCQTRTNDLIGQISITDIGSMLQR